MSRSPGFTIVELLIVIVVIGILATVALVSYTSISNNAVAVALQSDLKQAQAELSLRQLEDGSFHDTSAALVRSPSTTYQYTRALDGACIGINAFSSAAFMSVAIPSGATYVESGVDASFDSGVFVERY